MKRLMFALAASAAAISVAPAANAAILVNGANGTAFTAANPATFGTLLASQSQTGQAAVNPTFNATLRSAVYRNTFGTLDFWYQVTINSMDAGEMVTGLTSSAFTGYGIDALFSGGAGGDPDGGGIFTAPNNPGAFTSTASRNPSGFTIRSDFGANGLLAGETSATYIFRTSAVQFDSLGTFSAVDGSVFTVGNYQPIGPSVPEPATWAMMMLGFGAMGAVLRTRRRTTARIRFA